MIIRTVRDYFSASPIVMDPEAQIASTMLDIINQRDWVYSFKTQPPRISARVVGTEIKGNDEYVYIWCTEEDFAKVDQWLGAIEDEEP